MARKTRVEKKARPLLPESSAILLHPHPVRELIEQAQRGQVTERVLVEVVLHCADPVALLVTLVCELRLRVVVSLSGGKDSAAMLLYLTELLGVAAIHCCHYQYLPLDWEESLPYNQELCRFVGVPLVCEQMVYEPKPDSTHGVQRREVRVVQTLADAVGWEGELIGCATDYALRRGQPPSPTTRYCTGKMKDRLLDDWLRRERSGAVGEGGIGDPTALAMRQGYPPTMQQRACTAYYKEQTLDTWIVRQRAQAALGNLVIVALGLRARESARRAKLLPVAYRGDPKVSYQVLNWLPVHDWRRIATFRKLAEWGFAPHPAYERQGLARHAQLDVDEEGGPRTGCRFCIFATDADCQHQADDPANWEALAQVAKVEEATGMTWWMPEKRKDPDTGQVFYVPRRSARDLLARTLAREQAAKS